MSRRQKIHQTINEHCIPEVGVFGDVWVAKAEQSFWYATREGRVVNLSDVLNNVPAHTPPRHGKDGKDGIPIRGERGPAGRDGVCVCKKGLDSTAPGPIGPVGPAGVGKQGLQGPAGPDTATALADYFTGVAALRAEVSALQLICNGLVAQHKNTGEYIELLKARSAARRKQ